MSHLDLSYLADILEAAKLVQSFIVGLERDSFETDLMRQAAVIREIEIVGEATKRLSSQIRDDHPEIPWRQMAGMRDILIHAYNDVDLNEVWYTATVAIPELIKNLEPLLPPDESMLQ